MPQTPKISANDLARFLVSKPTTQISIVKNAKNPSKPPIIRYSDARKAVVEHLCDMTRSISPLVAAETLLQQRSSDPAMSSLRKDDALKSIDVLHAIQSMSNDLAPYQFVSAPQKQSKLNVQGVEVSVYANCLVHGAKSGNPEIGAAMLRMTQDDASTDAAKAKRKNMGLYVATMLRMHVDNSLRGNRKPANRLCMSIDVQHGEVFAAPNANAQRIKDINSACQLISALWPTL